MCLSYGVLCVLGGREERSRVPHRPGEVGAASGVGIHLDKDLLKDSFSASLGHWTDFHLQVVLRGTGLGAYCVLFLVLGLKGKLAMQQGGRVAFCFVLFCFVLFWLCR